MAKTLPALPPMRERKIGGMAFELHEIVRFLNHEKVRATYGAVAELVGGIPQSIGARLGSRRAEASWIVNAGSGMPTGYQIQERHPALLSKTGWRKAPDISGTLHRVTPIMNWLAAWLAVGGYILGFVSDIGKDYFKEILGDRRRERKALEGFSRVARAMPELVAELKNHLAHHEHGSELVVLPNAKVIYNDGPNSQKFRCYQERHEDLASKLGLLEDAGYLRNVTAGRNVPVYRMSQDFMDFVRKS
jgi:hypothetical protein